MSDRRLDIEIKADLQKLGMLLNLLSEIPLDQLAREIEEAQSFGPFFDPTGWMHHHKQISANQELVRLALPVWKAFRAAKAATAAEQVL